MTLRMEEVEAAITDAVENCEVCRGTFGNFIAPTQFRRRCCRCATFMHLLYTCPKDCPCCAARKEKTPAG